MGAATNHRRIRHGGTSRRSSLRSSAPRMRAHVAACWSGWTKKQWRRRSQSQPVTRSHRALSYWGGSYAAGGGNFVPTYPGDIEHYENIDAQDDPVQFIGMPDQFIDFKRKIDTAGDDGQPLCPSPLPPQSVALAESQRGIGNRDGRDHGDAGARYLVSDAQKLFRQPVVIGIDVKEKQNVLGSVFEVHIAPDHVNENVAGKQRQTSFERLNDRDGSEPGAVRVPPQSLLPAYGGAAGHG